MAPIRSIADSLGHGDDFEPLSGAEVAKRVGFPNYDTIEEIKNLQGMIRQRKTGGFPGRYTEQGHCKNPGGLP